MSDASVEVNGDSSQGSEPTQASTPEPSWWLDGKTPGIGDRPSYLPQKFKTVEDALKGYTELESRLGQAPSQYDLSKGESWMEPDYEPFVEMLDYAKSKHVPQDVMDRFLETVDLYLNEFRVDVGEELSKLGENGKQRIQVLNNWAKSNLSEKSYNALFENLRTAEAVEAVEEIRNIMLGKTTMIPTGSEQSQVSAESVEKIQEEMYTNFSKYKEDASYREDIRQRLEKATAAKGA